jgi:hypothetical protein
LCWLPALVPMADDAYVPGMGNAGRLGVRLLDLGILGPVRAVRAGRDVALGGPKQRAVLALLLIDAGRGGAGGISGRGAVAGVPAARGG